MRRLAECGIIKNRAEERDKGFLHFLTCAGPGAEGKSSEDETMLSENFHL